MKHIIAELKSIIDQSWGCEHAATRGRIDALRLKLEHEDALAQFPPPFEPEVAPLVQRPTEVKPDLQAITEPVEATLPPMEVKEPDPKPRIQFNPPADTISAG